MQAIEKTCYGLAGLAIVVCRFAKRIADVCRILRKRRTPTGLYPVDVTLGLWLFLLRRYPRPTAAITAGWIVGLHVSIIALLIAR